LVISGILGGENEIGGSTVQALLVVLTCFIAFFNGWPTINFSGNNRHSGDNPKGMTPIWAWPVSNCRCWPGNNHHSGDIQTGKSLFWARPVGSCPTMACNNYRSGDSQTDKIRVSPSAFGRKRAVLPASRLSQARHRNEQKA
jgi:hypothetical protein